MTKIIIFGGKSGYEILEQSIDNKKVEIIAFINNDSKLNKTQMYDIPVYIVEEGIKLQFDFIVIASLTYQNQMLNQLIELGVPYSKIVLPQFLYRKKAGEVIGDEFTQYQKEIAIFKDEFATINQDYATVFMNRKLEKPKINYMNYPDYLLNGIDYVRVSTLDLLSREIINNNIEGSIAELGVYQGDFSKLLGDLFPKRELLLFDTFEGFSKKDTEIEMKYGFSPAKVNWLNDTNEEIVLSKVSNNERVQIVKGYFPDSTIHVEDKKYALVSIDVDLYNPILSGLEYFYDRLSIGGYIIVHDYNFPHYSGVKAAVKKFTEKKGVYSVPIVDHHGSTIFVKNKK